MPKNEEGEFELVLGNRQLLSVFFIVVVLMGVFFTMGYIVGRNSAPLAPVETAKRTESKPMVVESPAPSQAPAASSEVQRPASEQQAPAQAQPTQPEARAPRPSEQPKPATPAPRPASLEGSAPAAGRTYLQVAAISKPDADMMVNVLREKGFRSLSMEVPEKPGIYRVFVGPYPDAAAIAQARQDLQKAGFNGPGALKKTF